MTNSAAMREILIRLYKDVFQNITRDSTSIFLIGGSARNKEASLREKLRKRLVPRRYWRGFDVYYPEHLFDELLKGKQRFDLLELENMLADSVHAVVIVLESAGSIAELGAFSNNPRFHDKLVVVVDKKYQKAKSFIQLGPIQSLKKTNKRRVIYADFSSNFHVLDYEIRRAVKHIRDQVRVNDTLTNPIALQHFMLSALYVFGPMTKENMEAIVKQAQGLDVTESEPLSPQDIYKIRSAVLGILLKNRTAVLCDQKYEISPAGRKKFLETISLSKASRELCAYIDEIRLNVLNYERKNIHLLSEGIGGAVQ